MAGSVKLYAWVTPAFSSGSPVDHTWVTTYDNRASAFSTVQQVVAAGESYWYCWGSFHPRGGTPSVPDGFIGDQAGDLPLAQCLVQHNADSAIMPAARGTIFICGVDGVCHQLANQVLYVTGVGGASAMTVRRARGYMASVFVYGAYGLQHAAWANKMASCSGQGIEAASAAGGSAMAARDDDFEQRAREVLEGQDPKLLADLLALRADVQRFAEQKWPGAVAPNAETLNARNQHLLDEASRLLGPERFEAIFGFRAGEKIDLVDPDVRASADGERPRQPPGRTR